MQFWLTKLKKKIQLLQRFPKHVIMEALFVILHFNYFYINGIYIYQVKGTAMGTPFAFVYANLVVAFIEDSMFNKLPEIYPKDIVESFINNYFRFLDDVFYKWKEEFDTNGIYQLLDELNPDIRFIFEELSTEQCCLDVKCVVVNNILKFYIYYKPTNSFTYLQFNSCHPKHTVNNIAYSLGKRIVQIVTENRDIRLKELKENLINRGHPSNNIDIAFNKPTNNLMIKKKILLH